MKDLSVFPKLLIAFLGFVLGIMCASPTDEAVANYNTLPYKAELINAYRQYYNTNEEMLDSIYSKYDIADGLGETDVVYSYEVAKDSLTKVMDKEDK